MVGEFVLVVCLRNIVEANEANPRVDFDLDPLLTHTLKNAHERTATIVAFHGANPNALAHKTLEMVGPPQTAIDAGRGNLEHVAARDHVVHFQQMPELAADRSELIQRHTALRSIEEQTQNHTPALPAVVDVDDLQAFVLHEWLGELPDPSRNGSFHLIKTKKVGTRPTLNAAIFQEISPLA